MLMGENGRDVGARAKRSIEEIQRSLSAGVTDGRPVYDRTELIDRTSSTPSDAT